MVKIAFIFFYQNISLFYRNELSSSLDKEMDITNQATKALEKQEQIATTLATKEEGFVRLIHYLKTYEKLPESKVGAIEQAAVASKCCMDHKYEDSNARLPTGKMIFRGMLIFEGVTIGTATAHKRTFQLSCLLLDDYI